MKKSFAKPILIFLLSILLLATLAAFASAEGDVTIVDSGTCGSNLTWTFDSAGTLTISGSGNMNSYSYTDDNGIYRTNAPWGTYYNTIQVVVLDEGVTSIGGYAFRGCTSLTSVTIPDSVTSIGNFAFFGCTSLTSVTIPDSVTSIGIYAFFGCTALTSVTIPDSVTSIGQWAFRYCTSLTSVTIPNSVTSIGSNAFGECTSLTSVTIPDSVTNIGDHAFDNCTSLTSMTIPDSVRSIGDWAFEYCTSLTSVTIPDSVRSIGNGVFGYCKSLTSVTIPDGVTSIGYYAFAGTSLTSVTIPDNVTSIGKSAFWRCTSLMSVTIGNSVTSIGDWAFYDCTALKDVYYTGTEEQWNQISISSGNTALTQATIHYESSGEGPIEKLGIDNDVNESVEFGSLKSVGVELNRSWFSQSVSNKRYHHGLARFCSAFSMIGYSSSKKITSYLQQCGFDILEYTENGKKVKALNMDTGRDEVNTFIAAKRITVDGAKKNLIFVGTIGSNDNQWYSDFDPYGKDREEQTPKTAFEDTHLGFADARDYAYGMLKNALEANGLDQQADDNILLFTGHSRGAATANILAAKVIDEGIWANQKSIYAYTFATPNSIDASKKTDLHDYKYLSIFNIVNPEDFVTKVMLKGWGYDRYGQTFVLPSKTNTSPSTYKNQLSSMRYYYSRFSAGGTYHPFSLGEESTWSTVIWMKLHVPTVDAFYRTKFSYTLPLYWVSPYEFFKDSLLVCLANKKLADKLPGITKLMLVMENPCAISFYQPLILYFANLSPEYFISLGAEELANVMNVSDFANAHAADTYCAYMYALSENEVTISKTSYIGSVNCPVDVEIIDKTTDEVVGRIVDNVVDEEIFAKENSVVMTVDGDKKSFWLPSDSDYEVKLIGNDRGTMDYMLSEIDSDIGELGRTNFFDVPLTGGLTYTSDVGKEDFSLSEYTLTREDGTVIQPDETFDAENMAKYSVTVSADENGTAGSDGTYTSGDYATVYAFPNEGCEFDGWYTDETCVSSEATYRFRVDSDVTLTAKFKQHEHVYESTITTEPTCTTDGETTYTCTCGDSYTKPIPATGNHLDDNNDGKCDTCGEKMTGGKHCKYCGKIHGGAFGWLVKFFHSIFAIFKR